MLFFRIPVLSSVLSLCVLSLCVLSLSVLCTSCIPNRLAGTEVGNPEITVSARFTIQGTGDSVTVMGMNIKCMGMTYHTATHSDSTIWDAPSGTMVDMADSTASGSMKAVTIRTGTWNKAELVLKNALGDASLPDSVGFNALVNPRYAKLVKHFEGEDHHFLFEMPREMGLKLMFEKSRIASWLYKDSLSIVIPFDAGKWVSALDQNTLLEIRKDGLGAPYRVLSPTENAEAYNLLKSMLPKCFMADSTEML